MSSPGEETSVVITRSLRIPLSELHFRFGPSGGPGGQHANKVATRVELRFDVAASSALDRVPARTPARPARERGPGGRRRGALQARNRRLAVERFRERIAAALRVEKPRRPTRPSAGATERRLSEKRRLSERKRARRPPVEE